MASHCTVPFWSRRGEKQDVKQRLIKQKAADASLVTDSYRAAFNGVSLMVTFS